MSLQQKRLEGLYRDAYLDNKLAERWREGDHWAALSCQGVPLNHQECLRIDRLLEEVGFLALLGALQFRESTGKNGGRGSDASVLPRICIKEQWA